MVASSKPFQTSDSTAADAARDADTRADASAAAPRAGDADAANPPLSRRRLRANRRNAKKSTGPRTAEGKRRAARNSISHGIFCFD
ncbi:MAG: hypothetical protein QOE14_3141, partial [Humisphaera sp.]|nr:hypothetical protein [Humisphaera sp.]